MDKNLGAAFMSTLLVIVLYAIYKYIKNFKAKQIEKDIVQALNIKSVDYKDFSTIVKNLKSLRDTNVLSESEFKNKIDTINIEILEERLIETEEYLRLKTLFNDGIFNKEEFDIKVKIIRDKIENEVDKITACQNEKLVIKPEQTNLKQENSNSRLINILLTLFVLTLISISLIISQVKEPESEINYDSPAVVEDTVVYNYQNSNNDYKEPIKNIKYVYIIFDIEKPVLKVSVFEKISSLSTNLHSSPQDIYSTELVKISFISDILEIEDYSEDNKNRILDLTEAKLYDRLRNFDSDYNFDIISKCKDETQRNELQEAKSKIVERNIYEFDTYSEASISKRNFNLK